MSPILYQIVTITDEVVAVATTVVAFLFRKNKSLHAIRFFLVTGLLELALMIMYGEDERIRSMLFNVFFLSDLAIFYFYFYRLLDDRKLRRLLRACFVTVLGITLFFWLGPINGFFKFTTTLYGLNNLFISIPCLVFIYSLFRSEEDTDLKTNPHFYVACGLLFYYAATFPFFITYKKLFSITPEILDTLISVQSIFSIIMYITILKAFLCPYPERKLLS